MKEDHSSLLIIFILVVVVFAIIGFTLQPKLEQVLTPTPEPGNSTAFCIVDGLMVSFSAEGPWEGSCETSGGDNFLFQFINNNDQLERFGLRRYETLVYTLDTPDFPWLVSKEIAPFPGTEYQEGVAFPNRVKAFSTVYPDLPLCLRDLWFGWKDVYYQIQVLGRTESDCSANSKPMAWDQPNGFSAEQSGIGFFVLFPEG